MDSTGSALSFPADEASGDSESDAGAVAAVGGASGRDVARGGEDDVDEEDRESVVGGGSEMDEGERGRDDDGGDNRRDDDGDEEGVAWSPEIGGGYESLEDEGDGSLGDPVEEEEDARERDRRFWEACLASGYP